MSSANDKSPGDEEAPRSRLRSRLSRLRKEGDTGKETELAPSGDKGGAGEDGAMPGADAGSAGESSRARGQNGEMGAAAHDPQEEKADIADGDPPPKGRLLLRARAGDAAADEMESGGAVRQEPQEPRGKVAILAPLSVLEPHRTDPMQNLRQRHKKMERVVATNLPEIHFAGQLVSGRGLIQDSTEGCCCRWKIEFGNCWQLLGGEISGQTQIAYSRNHHSNPVPFNHPIDIHFAESGIQGQGSPSILLQCYRLDWHGRLILAGYGFSHLPTTCGIHNIDVSLWIPVGSTSQELDSYFLGRSPALLEQGPIFETAWKERCRLVTAPAGTVNVQIFVMTRHMDRHAID